MIQKKWFMGAVALLMVAFLGMGCSSGGGGDDADTDISGLVGTWKASWTRVSTYYDYDNTETITIGADGSYSRIYVSEMYSSGGTDPISVDAHAFTGTVSREGNMVTITIAQEFESTSVITELPTTGWTALDESETFSYLIKDNRFYMNCLTRQGSGEGPTGTWTMTSRYTDVIEGYTMINEEEYTVVIDSSTITVTTVEKYYAKGYEDYAESDSDEDSYTYTIVDADTIAVTEDGYSSSRNWDWFTDGNTLVINMDPGSTPVKQ